MNERRKFLTAAASSMLILKPRTVFGSQANSTVEVGIVGCGNRGNWIGKFFPELTGARVVALADVIRQNLDRTRNAFQVAESRAYYGPDAYRELAHSKLEAVVIETPPYFHPQHAREAVEAGKHVYLAKPVAVDVPGCFSIVESGKMAAARDRTFLVDFQSRAQPVFQEAVTRIQRGDIGKPVFAQIFYFAGRPSKDKGKPGMDPGQRRVMNFFMDKAIGGDIIVEQNIHVIDMANWYIGGHPIQASGTGGRTDWTGTGFDAGDAYDHFLVHYWYPGEVHATFSSHQLDESVADLCVRLTGIYGTADTHYGGLVRITGQNAWFGTEKDDTFRSGARANVRAFVESIKTGQRINNAGQAVDSNLTAILGRMAAYQERLVTWDEMMKSTERMEADLQLRW